jgi:hypothetical protein
MEKPDECQRCEDSTSRLWDTWGGWLCIECKNDYEQPVADDY